MATKIENKDPNLLIFNNSLLSYNNDSVTPNDATYDVNRKSAPTIAKPYKNKLKSMAQKVNYVMNFNEYNGNLKITSTLFNKDDFNH